MKRILAFVMISLFIFLMTGCGENNPGTNPNGENKTGVTGTTQMTTKYKNQVTMQGYKYKPDVITVKVNETVTWYNVEGKASHTVRFKELKDASSGEIKKGKTYHYKFTKVGTYSYTCDIHPFMQGKVVVIK